MPVTRLQSSEVKGMECLAETWHTEWRRKWHPTPGFLPGKSHGQRSLAGYSSWGQKELDTTEHAPVHQDISQK